MVMRRIVYLLTVLFLSAGVAGAENHAPVVSNVQALQRPGTMLVDITYDVFDADGDTMAVAVYISDDDGQTFQVSAHSFEGDVGRGITSGMGKRVVWDAGVDEPNMYGTSYRPKVIADDGRVEGALDKAIGVGLPGGAVLEMVWIESGTFLMGLPDSHDGHASFPQHKVTISRGFHLGKYEVTQGQWTSVMGTKPWIGKMYVQDHPDHPAVYVSWDDAQAFIAKLNADEGATVWRLPTEAEWEYACRAGTTTLWFFGGDQSLLRDYAWYRGNATDMGERYAHKVGTKLQNPWGLYDMSGNVWEWVQDRAGEYSSEAQVDPYGSGTREERVIRGGDFGQDGDAYATQSAFRYYSSALNRGSGHLGFRLLRMDIAGTHGAAGFAVGHLLTLDTRKASDGATNAGNRAPVVLNVQAQQRPGTMLVDITYDVFDADGDTMTIEAQISDDDGQTFQIPAHTFEGNVGPGVTSGTGRRIVWNAGADAPNMHGTNWHPKVVATHGKRSDAVGETITLTLPGGPTLEMVWIENGTFLMGSSDSEQGGIVDRGPRHQVTITRGFHLGKYEVTQRQWESVMGTKPWVGQGEAEDNPDQPAVYVSWDDAQEFVSRLNVADRGRAFRLPTEAEWEYACRAGTTTRWSFGDDEGRLTDFAWYRENANRDGSDGPTYASNVGTKLPNPWGLYDMHGNVQQWVQDWYGPYSADTQVDPTGPASGSSRVVRGGSFMWGAYASPSAARLGLSPSWRKEYVGFRLLRVDVPEEGAIPVRGATSSTVGQVFSVDTRPANGPDPTAVDDQTSSVLPTALSLAVAPSPFNAETTIRIALPSPALVTLEILNGLGQVIASPVSGGRLVAGVHLARWGGRDEAGRAAASGVYTVVLRAGAEQRVQRAVLVR